MKHEKKWRKKNDAGRKDICHRTERETKQNHASPNQGKEKRNEEEKKSERKRRLYEIKKNRGVKREKAQRWAKGKSKRAGGVEEKRKRGVLAGKKRLRGRGKVGDVERKRAQRSKKREPPKKLGNGHGLESKKNRKIGKKEQREKKNRLGGGNGAPVSPVVKADTKLN